jgi:proteasome lid subunit RPN8/RPN11
VVADAPLVLPRALRDELVAHARAGLPNEACGILGGRGGRAERFYPAVNGEPSPYFYTIESRDLLRILQEIERDFGVDPASEDVEDAVAAIYHSHVESPAFPSRTDVEIAHWPDAAYLIVSLGSEPPDVRAFMIRDGRISRREIVLEG